MLLDNKKPILWNANIFLSLLVLVLLSSIAAHGHDCNGGDGAVKLNLLHRHHPKILERLDTGMNAEDMSERVREIHEHDSTRHRKLSELLDRKMGETRLQGAETTEYPLPVKTGIGLKMYSGAQFGSSEYFVELKVGSPPQDLVLIADTGSDLTWVKCRYRRCLGNCSSASADHKRRKQKLVGRLYYANRSSSFVPIPCNTNECGEYNTLFALKGCQEGSSFCHYDYSYAGGTSARGLFAVETLTVNLTDGTEKKLKTSVIGCTESVTGDVFKGSDGMIGLGSQLYSFAHKAAQSSHGGGFSYCLVDHLSDRTATSYFVLGVPTPALRAATTSAATVGKTVVTRLSFSEEFRGLYGVHLNAISVDGLILDIPTRVWDPDSGGGTIVDSGTSLTLLTTTAYDMVMEALIPKFSRFERVKVETFEFCFNDTRDGSAKGPKLAFHFQDGAVFEPPEKSFVVPVFREVSCLGFIPVPFPGTNILGNILQQNYLWEFDFFKHTLSFTPSECY